MKAKLKAKIEAVSKLDGNVTLSLSTVSSGKVEGVPINSQNIRLGGTVTLKELVANDMKIGAILNISISDEDSAE